MKKKIIIFLLLAIAVTSYSQGLYSVGNSNDEFGLFGESTTKKGAILRGEGQDEEGNDDQLFEVPAPENEPVGEGILLLTLLAGVYLSIENKIKRTR
jgi:hypothetical protein